MAEIGCSANDVDGGIEERLWYATQIVSQIIRKNGVDGGGREISNENEDRI